MNGEASVRSEWALWRNCGLRGMIGPGGGERPIIINIAFGERTTVALSFFTHPLFSLLSITTMGKKSSSAHSGGHKQALAKSTSLTSVGSSKRPPELRRNAVGTVVLGATLLALTAWVITSSVLFFTSKGAGAAGAAAASTGLLGVLVVRWLGAALCALPLALALAKPRPEVVCAKQTSFLFYSPMLVGIVVSVVGAVLQFVQLSALPNSMFLLALLANVALFALYVALSARSTSVLGRNVQPWYAKSPLSVSNVEIGHSVSMLRLK